MEAHKYGCLMAVVPSPLSATVLSWASKSVDKKHLAFEGLEDKPHVTILYGFKDPSPALARRVFDCIAPYGPIKIKLTGLSLFEGVNQDDGSTADCLKVDVASPTLHALNGIAQSHFDCHVKFPEYKPHLTLAYLQPRHSQLYKYLKPPFLGEVVWVTELVYSTPDGQRFTCNLAPAGAGKKGMKMTDKRDKVDAELDAQWDDADNEFRFQRNDEPFNDAVARRNQRHEEISQAIQQLRKIERQNRGEGQKAYYPPGTNAEGRRPIQQKYDRIHKIADAEDLSPEYIHRARQQLGQEMQKYPLDIEAPTSDAIDRVIANNQRNQDLIDAQNLVNDERRMGKSHNRYRMDLLKDPTSSVYHATRGQVDAARRELVTKPMEEYYQHARNAGKGMTSEDPSPNKLRMDREDGWDRLGPIGALPVDDHRRHMAIMLEHVGSGVGAHDQGNYDWDRMEPDPDNPGKFRITTEGGGPYRDEKTLFAVHAGLGAELIPPSEQRGMVPLKRNKATGPEEAADQTDRDYLGLEHEQYRDSGGKALSREEQLREATRRRNVADQRGFDAHMDSLNAMAGEPHDTRRNVARNEDLNLMAYEGEIRRLRSGGKSIFAGRKSLTPPPVPPSPFAARGKAIMPEDHARALDEAEAQLAREMAVRGESTIGPLGRPVTPGAIERRARSHKIDDAYDEYVNKPIHRRQQQQKGMKPDYDNWDEVHQYVEDQDMRDFHRTQQSEDDDAMEKYTDRSEARDQKLRKYRRRQWANRHGPMPRPTEEQD